MLILVGYVIVIASVIGGFVSVGGHLGAIYQPAEFVIIFGAALGGFVAGSNGKGLKATVKVLPTLFQRSSYRKDVCVDLITLLYLLLSKARQGGVMALEKDVDNPEDSPLFSQYPKLLNDTLLTEFITDYLRLMISGNMDAFEMEALMDHEIETFRHEAEVPAQGFAAMADALPAFGLVAAVLGVVHALGAVAMNPAGIGPLIAQALIGTFLGILLAYGFVSPLATRMHAQVDETAKILESVKVTLLASLSGYAPAVSIEFGRKALFSSERPSFTELEDHVRDVKKPSAAADKS